MPTAAQLMVQNADVYREKRVKDAELVDANVRIGMKWNSQLVANALLEKAGAVVQTGPFAGMRYHRTVAEGALAARLLGTYEAELHPHIARILERSPLQIVDIGCAEGYYAVGFARLAPFTKIRAFDISEPARKLCTELAELNEVSGQVSVGGLVDHRMLEELSGPDSFVFCDIEGAEVDLLDPAKVPSLAQTSIIVETHPMAAPGATELLSDRFSKTHRVSLVREKVKPVPDGHWLADMATVDQFLATWEWRYRPTPWLVLEPMV